MNATATAGDRPTDLRLARVHLRMGALELARAELESFAGRGVLDAPALLDLAEVRWRTGDLPGAGVAASAYLGTDDTGVLALVIAAEAAAAVGHPGDARRLAQEALERIEEASAMGDPAAVGLVGAVDRSGSIDPPGGGPEHAPARADGPSRVEALSGAEVLDALFAGMPQSQVWPMRPHFRVEPTGLLFVTPLQGGRRAAGHAAGETEAVAGAGDRGDETGGIDRWPGADAPAPGPGTGRQDEPSEVRGIGPDEASDTPGLWGDEASDGVPLDEAPPAHPELIEARAALEAGDATVAAARLGDLLRRRPDLAGSVLSAIAAGPGDAVPDAASHSPDPSAEAPLGAAPEQERP